MTINKFNLAKSQLAFAVGKEVTQDGQTIFELYSDSIVFSLEMTEGETTTSDAPNSTRSPVARSVSPTSLCRVYKYAPKYGYEASNEEMVIFLTKKLEANIYGGESFKKVYNLDFYYKSNRITSNI